MKKISIVTLVIGLAVGMSACNSGSTRRTGGKMCPADYKPNEVKLGKGQKAISMVPADKQMLPGTYEYTGSTTYYRDTATDFRVEITDAKDPKKDVFKATATCVRNPKAGLNFSFAAQGVSRIEIDNEYKTFFDTKEIKFDVNPQRFTITSTAKLEKTEGIPSKAYEDIQAGTKEYMMIKINDSLYEIRSHVADKAGEYYLTMRFKYAKPGTKPAKVKRS